MLLGPVQSTPLVAHSFVSTLQPSLDETLKLFWEVPSKTVQSPEDDLAESQFRSSVFRLPSGRFGVCLPFKANKPSFANSMSIADHRWLRVEKRLLLQPHLYDLYKEFMLDYLNSNHMSSFDHPIPEDSYFIPHHCVVKSENGKPKIRVVFDASAKDANNLSLNDTLCAGPKLQADLVAVLLSFRVKPFVFTCDIRQMYRQILIAEEDRKFQFIRFRFSESDSIRTFQLNTVTYGVSSAPFLAIRTIHHLASLHEKTYPLAHRAVFTNLYVDDFVCGSMSLEEAREMKSQLISLLGEGGLELRKWASNTPELLVDLPDEHVRARPTLFDSPSDTTLKILGLQWDSSDDSFSFSVENLDSVCSKRKILSQVARIYDPIGFLTPLSFLMKRLIQHLWTLGLGWDDTPPQDVQSQWNQIVEQLTLLSSLKIPRLAGSTSITDYELHAFCDASRHGYAAVLYLRYSLNGIPTVRFLTSKSKVAPLKSLSIPRLELCGAVLLAKLVAFVCSTFKEHFAFSRILAWSDSTAVITWVRSPPYKWKTFVSNRVVYIQERVPPESWHHIAGSDNPADPPSRGLLPKELVDCDQWWAGPAFLGLPECQYSSLRHSELSPPPALDLEERSCAFIAQAQDEGTCWAIASRLLNNFSSLPKILRIVAYMCRFVNRCRDRPQTRIGPPFSSELIHALLILVRSVQRQTFAADLLKLKAKAKSCAPVLQKLGPFIDSDGILRAGGRLRHSTLPFETKHPAILPQRHILTDLLIDHVHRSNCHPGPNTTLYLIRQRFWILAGRRAVTRRLKRCLHCFRAKPVALTPPMGDLPRPRVSQLKPFSHTGVDYGGPFAITMLRKKGARTFKAYVCLFVCFATKALHIEVASDLTTDCFLAALRRFIARRGRCSQLFSDCGTNFVGANRVLNEHMHQAAEQEAIQWSFNPPSAPHFGGLWESGIKSLKTHLTRVVGNQILTFEELCTVTAQVEATLNSRPLTEISSDVNDLTPLTPGHFLTLEPLCAPPDADLSSLNRTRLSRWQLVQSMHQEFWRRWSHEYLHTLCQRSKWYKPGHFEPVDINRMVLIKDDNAPPLKWRLGRIVALHPGTDGVARVATVRTLSGLVKRPLVKLCALPTE